MRINLKLSQQGFILVGVPIAVMLSFLVILLLMLNKVEQQEAEADRSKTIISKADLLVKEYFDAGSQLLFYKYTKNEANRQNFEQHLASSEENFKDLHQLLQNDPNQLSMLDSLQASAEKGMTLLRNFEHRLQANENIPTLEATMIYKDFNRAGVDFTNKQHQFVDDENQKHPENAQEAVAQSRNLIKGLVVAGAVADIAIGLLLAWLFTLNTTSKLDKLIDNTKRLSRKDQLLPPLEGSDEIARLDRFFHVMASDLAEATRKERAILDNAVDVICSIDREGKFTAVNPASLSVWGYTPEDLIGLRYSKLIAKDDVAKFRAALEQLRQNPTLVTIENQVVTPNGEMLHMLWSLRWSEAEQSLFCVAHDITDRKRVEQLKQEFLAVISHELRTPLTSLQATLTLLSHGAYGPLSEKGEKRVRSAESGAARLILLINDLLDIEKMEAGKLSMTYRDVNLTEIIDNSMEAVRGFAEEHGIIVTPEPKAAIVLADGDRMVQVVVNLLSNAIKFSADGGTVEIRVAENGELVELQVIDHGAGIPAGYEDKIFAKYEQGPTVSGKKMKGTGLGLPICRAIIEQHGGSIGVRPTPGGGSTFWFSLPRVGSSVNA